MTAINAKAAEWRSLAAETKKRRNAAIRRGDAIAADVYDTEERILTMCADELEALLAGEGTPSLRRHVEGTVACLRRFDPVLRQTVFEPLPPAGEGTPAPGDVVGGIIRETFTDVAEAIKQIAAERDVANKAAAEWRDKLAAVTVERDNYRTLAGIGAWHADCRPNRHQAAETIRKQQKENDKLADRITALEDKRRTTIAALTTLARDLAKAHVETTDDTVAQAIAVAMVSPHVRRLCDVITERIDRIVAQSVDGGAS